MAMLAATPESRMIAEPTTSAKIAAMAAPRSAAGRLGTWVWSRNSGRPGRKTDLRPGQQVCQAEA